MNSRLAAVAFAATVALSSLLATSPARAGDWEDCAGTDSEVSIRGCTAVIAAGKANVPQAYYNRAIEYDNKQQHEQAIADFDQAIRLKPDNPAYYNNRGFTQHKKGQFDRAIADFDKAIQLRPGYERAIENRRISVEAKAKAKR